MTALFAWVDWDVWQVPLTLLGCALLAGLLAHLLARLARQVGRARQVEALTALYRTCHRSWLAAAVTAALLVAAGPLQVGPDWTRVLTIALIGAATWLIVNALSVVELVIMGRLRMDVRDNKRVRRARTQVTLLRRMAAAVVVLLGVAAVLMSFPTLRTFGASLLASAGLAGILAGLAAQTTLGNVIAGLQLAFTDALRVDDVVVVEGEWGRVEDLTLTYVVIAIWDERRMVLPTSYFTTTPFQNWTRNQARILGSVILYLDYRTPLEPLRERTRQVVQASPHWDGRDWGLQVTDTTESAMVVRVVASAPDGPAAFDLRCEIREALLVWLAEQHPSALPTRRALVDGLAVPQPVERWLSDGVPA